MIKIIGKAARNNYLVAFFNALKNENKKMVVSINDLEKFILFSLESKEIVKQWEIYLDLPDVANWSLQDRKERIIYTINSNEICTVDFLKRQALIFTNGEIDIVEDFSNYHFKIQFTNMLGVPPNIENFREMVNINKPAHLTYEIKYRYRTWGEVKEFTWNEIAQHTWEEARSKEGILNGIYY